MKRREKYGLNAAMWPYYPELLAANVPRYTSYPTAVEFDDTVGADALTSELNAISANQPISLYLHIPYCQQICWYCGCNTGAAGREKRLTSYLAALEAEIVQIAGRLGGRGRIKQIAFGGGSPNAIAPVDFVRLTDRIFTMFSCDNPRISVELDPRIFSTEWAATLARCGVSRVSLGVQSFSKNIQQAIGRIQPVEMIESCIGKLRDVGIGAVNFDLMYGLPDQSLDDLQETLEITDRLAPSRIALFGYAHMPQLFPRQRRIDGDVLPDAKARFAMADMGYQYFTSNGFAAIGFDHFAQADDSLAIAATHGELRRNFQGFTDDDCDIMIGIGASAISNFPGHIIQNEKNPGRYRMLASAGNLSAVRGVKRSVDDRLRGRLIERTLCEGNSGPVPLPIRDHIKAGLQPFVERGLAAFEDGCVRVKPEGIAYSRTIAWLFDGYRQGGTKQFSLAV